MGNLWAKTALQDFEVGINFEVHGELDANVTAVVLPKTSSFPAVGACEAVHEAVHEDVYAAWKPN